MKRERGKKGKGLRKSPGRGTTHSKTDNAEAVIGAVEVAVGGAAIPRNVDPGTATDDTKSALIFA